MGGRRTRYRIDGVRGLLLEVTPTNRKTWYVRYQVGSGMRRTLRFYRIGDATAVDLGVAIKRAREVVARVDVQGVDVFQEEKTATVLDDTFAALFELWHQRHAVPRLAQPENERRLYRLYVEPRFGAMPVSGIKRAHVRDHRDKIAETCGPIASNHMVSTFNRVMNWAVEEGYIEFNPAYRLRKIGDARPRERILSEDEIRLLWRALDRTEHSSGDRMRRREPGRMLTPGTRAAMRIMLLTGQRRVEVAGTRKTELELSDDNPIWTIPGKRTKNRLLHRVPLAPLAMGEFRKALSVAGPTIFVLPSGRSDQEGHLRPDAITKAMQRLCREIGITGVGPHDLRRTVGTELARLGVSVHVRALILNHSPRGRGITDKVYNRYSYDDEKRAALTMWEMRLAEIVSPASDTSYSTEMNRLSGASV